MPSENRSRLPRIRILHQMARSGGTVICKCLASMEAVVLLSEIHPLGTRMFNPLQQATEWYGLLTPEDLGRVREEKWSFAKAIGLVAERCAMRDQILVLRDWSHLDYIGIPFTQPSYRSGLVASLQQDYELIRFSSVRHPLDQWLSLTRNPLFAEQLGISKYLKGTRRFAEMASNTGFVRYEDFTQDPGAKLSAICNSLQIPYDASWQQRWSDYDRITGDVMPGRAGRQEISTLPRQEVESAIVKDFEGRPDYRKNLELTGYQA